MQFLRVSAAITLGFVFSMQSNLAQADYQAGLAYVDIKLTEENNDEVRGKALAFAYYLEPIKLNDQPWAEAVYLQRVSHIQITTMRLEGEFNSTNPKLTADGNLTTLGFSYLDKASPFIASVSYGTGSTDYKRSVSPYSIDNKDIEFVLGSYIAQTTSVIVGYKKTDNKYSPTGYSQNDYTRTTLGLGAKHLVLREDGTAIAMQGSYSQIDYDRTSGTDYRNTKLELNVDYYFTNRYSAGLGVTQTSGDDNGNKGRDMTIRGMFYLTTAFSVSVMYVKFDGEGQSVDGKGYGVALAYQF